MKLWPSIIPPTLGPVISHFQDVSTCCWFWFFPTARSAWNATRPALTWPSPSTRTPADVNWHLGIRQARIILNNKQIRGLSESVSILVSLPYKHGHRPLGHSPCPKQYGLFHTLTKKKKNSEQTYPAPQAFRFAPLSIYVDFQVQPGAGQHWRLQHRHLLDHCFPGKEGQESLCCKQMS